MFSGAHDGMGFISAPAHLPFKVSLIIPNNLMGCSLRALILPLPCSRVSTTPTLGKSKPLWGAGLSAYWVFSTCFPDPLSPLRHSALCPRFRYSLASGWVQPRGSTSRRLDGRRGEGWSLAPPTLWFDRGCLFSPWPRLHISGTCPQLQLSSNSGSPPSPCLSHQG